MPLSNLIVTAYKTLIEIALWATLLLSLIGGASVGLNASGGGAIIGLLVGGLMWLIVATIFFGAFLVLIDIRDRVKQIETQQGNHPL